MEQVRLGGFSHPSLPNTTYQCAACLCWYKSNRCIGVIRPILLDGRRWLSRHSHWVVMLGYSGHPKARPKRFHALRPRLPIGFVVWPSKWQLRPYLRLASPMPLDAPINQTRLPAHAEMGWLKVGHMGYSFFLKKSVTWPNSKPNFVMLARLSSVFLSIKNIQSSKATS